ncbi:o-succinylbenzoate synthase [Aeromicrobium fastidiosum]|uniref:o-succinylbenzoate synthase n=1 Tax=Aeromicrobium fastidiosum TaxID=52699 RepID=A0A641AMX7_9ACTN|nr:o-succinylbenzoate synthase [Aeromicrobium fastidiosum]KAA1378473.1 o-succinylbenzoate synthase [Aeromicrobium fastidiosum]MBP2392562.1 O-succinylbenzoate synthase [Aeromicrobium fastidiosum]
MRIRSVRMYRLRLPLVRPFRTSFGTSTAREALVLRIETDDAIGWAECAADPEPLYSEEFLDSASIVITDHLLPRLLAAGDTLTAADVARTLAPVSGHPMAKHVLETAVLDAELRAAGVSFAHRLGAVRPHVRAGVSVGIAESIPVLLDEVGAAVEQGYPRIKLKIEPGWDVEPVRAVREAFGDIDLQVDANAAYDGRDIEHLARLDAFDLVLIEQPFAENDLLTHAAATRRWATPVCLDESIRDVTTARTALHLGACSIINIKPARVGGYLHAVAVHDLAVAQGVPVWCGGMLETGIGRAGNVALAALAGFTLPGDVSASQRYYAEDITEPFVLRDGGLDVPSGPGLGVEVDPSVVAHWSVETRELIGSRR